MDFRLPPDDFSVPSDYGAVEKNSSLDFFIESSADNHDTVFLSDRLQSWKRAHRRWNCLLRQPMLWQADNVRLFLSSPLGLFDRSENRLFCRSCNGSSLYCCRSNNLL